MNKVEEDEAQEEALQRSRDGSRIKHLERHLHANCVEDEK